MKRIESMMFMLRKQTPTEAASFVPTRFVSGGSTGDAADDVLLLGPPIDHGRRFSFFLFVRDYRCHSNTNVDNVTITLFVIVGAVVPVDRAARLLGTPK